VTYTLEQVDGQCLALSGTVLRSQNDGSGNEIAKAGVTASFIAIKRDFSEPRI
jgi:hypothetical protein